VKRPKFSAEELSRLGPASRAVFYEPEEHSQSTSYPLYLSSNFEYDREIYQRVIDGERHDVNIYSRCGNPTEYRFEEHMARLENADGCIATSSGMAAISTVLFSLLKAGDHVVSDWTTYSSTHEGFDHRWTEFGVQTTFVDSADVDQVKKALKPNTKILYVETIANPIMKVPDLRALATLAHQRGIILVCDNTFASPSVCRPLDFGADIVVESATKFISGHGDALGGVIAWKTGLVKKDYGYDLRWNSLTKLGGAISPFNAWLILRGAQTLPLRMERHCQNAAKLATFMETRHDIRRVWYPGLSSHPQHGICRTQMPSFGAMLAVETESESRGVEVLNALRLCSFAGSLGSVRTTCQVPSTMAFLDVPREQKAMMNIRDGLIRISVGIEDIDDIIDDFARALDANP